jgi:hypothetical protein
MARSGKGDRSGGAADMFTIMDQMLETLRRSLRERALEPELIDQILDAVRGDEAARITAAEALDQMAKRAAADADRSLRDISPESLCHWAAVVMPALNGSGYREFLVSLGLERFLWVVGAGASGVSGASSSVAALTTFFAACAQWATAQTTERLVRVPEPEVFAIAFTEEDGESTRRFTAYLAQFGWISRSICLAVARAVAELRLGSLVPHLTVESVEQAADLSSFDWYEPGGLGDESSLQRALSIRTGEYSSRSFLELVQAREMELFPFIQVGSKVLPVAERVIRIAFEQPVLEYVKRCVDNEQRGAVFERACEIVLNEAIDLEPPVPGTVAAVRVSARDEGEIDFLVEGNAHEPLVIGEAKAYFTASAASAAYNAFTAEVGKAHLQLERRLEAVAEGGVVSGVEHAGDRRRPTIGLGVPMHSYGGAIWRGPLWRHEISEISSDLAVIPVHQAVLVFSLMTDLTQLADYFRFRAEFFCLPVPVVMDEADLLVLYLSGQGDDALRRARVLGRKDAVHIPPHAPDLAFAIAERPEDRSEWRRMFFEGMNKTDALALLGARRL